MFGNRWAAFHRSETYVEAAPAFTAGRVDLPRNAKLKNQLVMLERKVARRDSVDHPVGMHDDCALVACGIIVEVLRANGVGGMFGLLELQATGQALQALEPPQAITTVFPSPGPPEGKYVNAPSAQQEVKHTYWKPATCMNCGGVDTLREAERPGMWQCTKCNHLVMTSWAAPSPSGMTRGEYLAGREKQPGQFGRAGRRSLFGRFGG